MQVVSKHLLNEPNFALGPKYHLYTYESKHARERETETETEAGTLRPSCEKYPNFLISFLLVCFLWIFFLRQLRIIPWDERPKFSIIQYFLRAYGVPSLW